MKDETWSECGDGPVYECVCACLRVMHPRALTLVRATTLRDKHRVVPVMTVPDVNMTTCCHNH